MQNGHTKQLGCTLMDKAEYMWHQACIPDSWWEFAFTHATHIYSCTPVAHLKWCTPMKCLKGRCPILTISMCLVVGPLSTSQPWLEWIRWLPSQSLWHISVLSLAMNATSCLCTSPMQCLLLPMLSLMSDTSLTVQWIGKNFLRTA